MARNSARSHFHVLNFLEVHSMHVKKSIVVIHDSQKKNLTQSLRSSRARTISGVSYRKQPKPLNHFRSSLYLFYETIRKRKIKS